MATLVMKDGRQLVNATVLLPKDLRTYAADHGVSMSRLLREALEEHKSQNGVEA